MLLFFVFRFGILLFLTFGYLSKTSLEKLEFRQPQKWKRQKKQTCWQEQLAQVCSQIVSVFLFGVSLNFACCAENTKNVASAKKQKYCVQSWSKVVLQTGPSMLRNKIGPVFNTTCWSLFCLFLVVFWKLYSFCRENEIQKKRSF